MNLFYKLAARNLWRNPRRSLLTLLVIAIGCASLILADGFVIGMNQTMVALSTNTWLGHAHIKNKLYIESDDDDKTIPLSDNFIEKLKNISYIKSFSPRINGLGNISSSFESSSVMITGVELHKDPSGFKMAAFLDPILKDDDLHAMVIGKDLQKKLKLEMNDKVVITSSNLISGELTQELFRLKGVFATNAVELDKSLVLIPFASAEKLFGTKDVVHHISLIFHDIDLTTMHSRELQSIIIDPKIQVSSYRELLPAIQSMLDMSGISVAMIFFILIFLIGFAVMNSIFMAMFERHFELAIMKALGTKPRTMGLMILSECTLLSILGSLAGMLIALLMGWYLNQYGLQMSDMQFAGVELSEPIRFLFRHQQWWLLPASIIGIGFLAGIFPAYHAYRLIPREHLGAKI